MRYPNVIIFVIAAAGFATTVTAQEKIKPSPELFSSMTGMRLQLDTLLKNIPNVTNETAIIYRNIDDQLKTMCKTIYCDDDRRNYNEVSLIEQRASESSFIFVRQGLLIPELQANSWSLPSTGAGLCTPAQIIALNRNRPAGAKYEVERFYDEPAPGFCSGFRVGKDLVATAAHCVRDALDCQSIKLINGFRMSTGNPSPTRNINGRRIYACKEIVERKPDVNGAEWAIIRVDREMGSHVPTVTLRSAGSPKVGDGLTVIGHPLGLPVKIAGNGVVRKVEATVLMASTDTYRGNSGSAVFSRDALARNELLAEGLLVRGDADFEPESLCRVSKRCTAEGCKGEVVTLAAQFRASSGQ